VTGKAGTQQQVVQGWHKALSEQEDAVIKCDKYMAGGQSACSSTACRKVTTDRRKATPFNIKPASYKKLSGYGYLNSSYLPISSKDLRYFLVLLLFEKLLYKKTS
jgi:hypothetical protein